MLGVYPVRDDGAADLIALLEVARLLLGAGRVRAVCPRHLLLERSDLGDLTVRDSEATLAEVSLEPRVQLVVVDERWRGIGVRIEDDLIVTEDGFENMTQAVPKTIEEIENLMNEESYLSK